MPRARLARVLLCLPDRAAGKGHEGTDGPDVRQGGDDADLSLLDGGVYVGLQRGILEVHGSIERNPPLHVRPRYRHFHEEPVILHGLGGHVHGSHPPPLLAKKRSQVKPGSSRYDPAARKLNPLPKHRNEHVLGMQMILSHRRNAHLQIPDEQGTVQARVARHALYGDIARGKAAIQTERLRAEEILKLGEIPFYVLDGQVYHRILDGTVSAPVKRLVIADPHAEIPQSRQKASAHPQALVRGEVYVPALADYVRLERNRSLYNSLTADRRIHVHSEFRRDKALQKAVPFLRLVLVLYGKFQRHLYVVVAQHPHGILAGCGPVEGRQVQVGSEVSQPHPAPHNVQIRDEQVSLQELGNPVHDNRLCSQLHGEILQFDGDIGVLDGPARDDGAVEGIVGILPRNQPHQWESPYVAHQGEITVMQQSLLGQLGVQGIRKVTRNAYRLTGEFIRHLYGEVCRLKYPVLYVPQDVTFSPVGGVYVGIGDGIYDEAHRVKLSRQGDFRRPAQLAFRLLQLEGLYPGLEILKGFHVEVPVKGERILRFLQ